MSNRTRALAIGLIGPAISGLGLVWVFFDAALDPTPESANLRFFLFDSAHLVTSIGVLVSALCTPLAISVALATPKEVKCRYSPPRL
ncbi:MAG: hypothetical protein ABIP58_08920 [Dehalococcoidia bacterium]